MDGKILGYFPFTGSSHRNSPRLSYHVADDDNADRSKDNALAVVRPLSARDSTKLPMVLTRFASQLHRSPAPRTPSGIQSDIVAEAQA